jgi:medium-chain acyl-[acyl-carrier-protein] hydrolase
VGRPGHRALGVPVTGAADGAAPARPWIRRFERAAPAEFRLYCFPFAGGSAGSYLPWCSSAPDTLELAAVQLPGRQDRLGEPPCTDIRELAPILAAAVERDAAGRPYALFGHSLGALLAFETARELRRSGAPPPGALAVAGHRAPHWPPELPPVHGLPESQFVGKLQEIGGMAPELVAHQEFMRVLLPTLRADFTMAETYQYVPGPPLAAPVIALGGDEDALASLPGIRAWGEVTTAGAVIRAYPGGHFFPWQHAAAILQVVAAALGPPRA